MNVGFQFQKKSVNFTYTWVDPDRSIAQKIGKAFGP
jgi:hypothetical protein